MAETASNDPKSNSFVGDVDIEVDILNDDDSDIECSLIEGRKTFEIADGDESESNEEGSSRHIIETKIDLESVSEDDSASALNQTGDIHEPNLSYSNSVAEIDSCPVVEQNNMSDLTSFSQSASLSHDVEGDNMEGHNSEHREKLDSVSSNSEALNHDSNQDQSSASGNNDVLEQEDKLTNSHQSSDDSHSGTLQITQPSVNSWSSDTMISPRMAPGPPLWTASPMFEARALTDQTESEHSPSTIPDYFSAEELEMTSGNLSPMYPQSPPTPGYDIFEPES